MTTTSTTGWRTRFQGVVREIRLRARIAGRAAWRQHRRSLQLRVAIITMAVAGAVVIIISLILFDQIRTQQLTAKIDAAVSQAQVGVQYASIQVVAVPTGDPLSIRETLQRTVDELQTRGGNAGQFAMVMINRDTPTPLTQPTFPGLTPALPAELVTMVGERTQAYQYAVMPTDDGTDVPSLVVGAAVPSQAGSYELYYIFPLDQEKRSLDDIRSTVVVSGLALVVLVAGIGALVTRLVVSPVRLAAQTAEQLASGQLQRRLPIRGEDDLARLAGSFNRMAASLQRQITQLEDLSRLQQRFTSDVSHELRTPLTTVRMAADILHSARVDFAPDVARSAELLQTELGRFEGLLTDLLEISRYDAGAASLVAEPTELVPLVEDVLAATQPMAQQRAASVQVRVPDEPVIAEIDPRRIERILRNLILNAIHHGGGLIEVTLGASKTAAAITVRDHGPGMTAEETSRVFDRFWRADPARSRHGGGTGLGLSISREDARLHGGWLQAWGRPGQGAQFRLTLPLVQGVELEGSPLPLEPRAAIIAPYAVAKPSG
ncbi:MAG: MtrAB system histidine kinase MtrB, partial [Actinomycetota bacterium]|nr:MtrAB system histidine kinase MtrB [Actinomycetota bacterium]